MMTKLAEPLAKLYEADEIAWLDTMVELIAETRLDELDYNHLKEFLEDMARRDRREIESRLEVLFTHLLKWTYQKKKRTQSWRRTIIAQRRELERNLKTSKTLRNYAETSMAEIYADAVEWAAEETELPLGTFPPECPWTLDQLLSPELLA